MQSAVKRLPLTEKVLQSRECRTTSRVNCSGRILCKVDGLRRKQDFTVHSARGERIEEVHCCSVPRRDNIEIIIRIVDGIKLPVLTMRYWICIARVGFGSIAGNV